jgi:uncharacterized protein (TIGR00106 family)
MAVLLEFSMYPLGKGESISEYVARSLKIVESSALPYKLHAMGTVLEGEYEECMRVVQKCFEAMKKDCARVEIVLKVDYRKDRKGALSSKVAAVERRLGKRLIT